MEFEVDEIGPLLRCAAAKVNRTQRSSHGAGGAVPANQGNPAGNGQARPGWGDSLPVTADGPWAIPGGQNDGG